MSIKIPSLSKMLNLSRNQDDLPAQFQQPEQKISGWQPSYLRRRVLIVFVITFCAVIAALKALNHVSQVHNGIASSNESHHYLWTYGPTAIFTVIGAFWSRVEFQVKQRAPWKSMAEKPVEARESILLDYVSEIQLASMAKAIRKSTLTWQLELPALCFCVSCAKDVTFNAPGAQAFDILNRVLFENDTYPEGTNADLAFQQFSAPGLAPNAIVIAPVDGMMADLGCETASIEIKKWDVTNVAGHSHHPNTRESNGVNLRTPSCTISNVALNSALAGVSPYVAKFASGQCDDSSGEDGMRIVVTLAEVSMGKLAWNTSRLTETNTTTEMILNRSIQLICNPTYSLVKLQAETNTSQSSSPVNLSAMTCIEAVETLDTLTRFQLPGFDITDDHPPVPDESSARSAPNVNVPWISWNNFKTTDATPENPNLDGFFTALVMGKYAIPAEDLLNPDSSDMVIKAINHQDRILRAQVFNNYSRSAADETLQHTPLPGNITLSNRLRLSQDAASTRILEALLASTLVLGIVGSILMNTDHVLPKNPFSIAAIASLLADSNILARYETVMGDPNEQSLGHAFFSRCRFFLGFKGGVTSDQGDPWQIPEDQVCQKYCIYLSERDGETISGNAWMWARKEFRAKETRVEERMV